jgi:hypothetical protein
VSPRPVIRIVGKSDRSLRTSRIKSKPVIMGMV